MRKVLWSPDEDERLVRCIRTYVHGSWSDIARNAGLNRCGKSCRRRWLNHLRPDLKRGKFSMDEINLIVQLHEAMGNRWSDIARQLKGRTDNDVKNLWNTQIKKKKVAPAQNIGDPILPPTVNQAKDTTSTSNASSSTSSSHQLHVLKDVIPIDSSPMSMMSPDIMDTNHMQSCDVESADNGDLFLITRTANDVSKLDCSCSTSTLYCKGHSNSYEQNILSSSGKPTSANLQIHQNSTQLIWENNHDHSNYSICNNNISLFLNELTTEKYGSVDDGVPLMLTRSCSLSSSSSNNLLTDSSKYGGSRSVLASASMALPTPEQHPILAENYLGSQLNFAGSAAGPFSMQRDIASCRYSSASHTYSSDCTTDAGVNVNLADANIINNEDGYSLVQGLIGGHCQLSTFHEAQLAPPIGQSSNTVQQFALVDGSPNSSACINNTGSHNSALNTVLRPEINQGRINNGFQPEQNIITHNGLVGKASHSAAQSNIQYASSVEQLTAIVGTLGNDHDSHPLPPLGDAVYDHESHPLQKINCMEEWENILAFPDLWKLLLLLN